IILFFFFQAEDGIRDKLVTGVQTCALPISFMVQQAHVGSALGPLGVSSNLGLLLDIFSTTAMCGSCRTHCLVCRARNSAAKTTKIGRASCRERGDVKRGSVWYNIILIVMSG